MKLATLISMYLSLNLCEYRYFLDSNWQIEEGKNLHHPSGERLGKNKPVHEEERTPEIK